MVIIAQGPGALWAGAITPITVQNMQRLGSIAVPQFTAATRAVWDSEFELKDLKYVWNYVQNCTASRGEVTYVSNCPVPNQQKALLESARSATAGRGAVQNYSKPDNPTWTYHGRSYGVGSAQGLREVEHVPEEYRLLGYTYNETGYEPNVACMRNASANLTVVRGGTVANVDIWNVEGQLPNSLTSEFYPVMSWHRDTLDQAAVLACAAVSNPYDGLEHMVGIVASALYGKFSNLQCDITFTPRKFSVGVNVTTHTMAVSPIDDVDTFDLDPTGHLQSNAVYSLNLLSRMSSSLYVSILGEALTYNLETLATDADEAIVLRSTEESFVAMLDNVLGIYGGSQLVLADDSSQMPIDGVFSAVRLGQKSYQWAVLILNGVLLVILGAEAIRTQWWRGLPHFDPLDFKSVVASTSFGGNTIATELRKQHAKTGGMWLGDPKDKALGDINVHLEQGSKDIAIVIARGADNVKDSEFADQRSLLLSS
jgi:hypothetical protein